MRVHADAFTNKYVTMLMYGKQEKHDHTHVHDAVFLPTPSRERDCFLGRGEIFTLNSHIGFLRREKQETSIIWPKSPKQPSIL